MATWVETRSEENEEQISDWIFVEQLPFCLRPESLLALQAGKSRWEENNEGTYGSVSEENCKLMFWSTSLASKELLPPKNIYTYIELQKVFRKCFRG